MKREFLQNFKVGDQPLPNQIIDAIMDEHGKGIEREKAKYADYETIKEQLKTAKETIEGLKGQDIEGIKKSAADWENKYNTAVKAHEQQMADIKTAIEGLKKESGYLFEDATGPSPKICV